MMELEDMLEILAKQDGSDLYLATNAPPAPNFRAHSRHCKKR